MGERDIENLVQRLVEANREANKPLGNRIVWASVSVIFSIVCGCIYIGGYFRDVDNLKKFQTETQPIVNEHTTKIAVINQVLKIK